MRNSWRKASWLTLFRALGGEFWKWSRKANMLDFPKNARLIERAACVLDWNWTWVGWITHLPYPKLKLSKTDEVRRPEFYHILSLAMGIQQLNQNRSKMIPVALATRSLGDVHAILEGTVCCAAAAGALQVCFGVALLSCFLPNLAKCWSHCKAWFNGLVLAWKRGRSFSSGLEAEMMMSCCTMPCLV